MLIYKCSVCKKGFSRRAKWHGHLPQRKHQDLARKELAGWDANVRAKVLVFVNLPPDNDVEILNTLSDNGKVVIADFVVSSEAPQRIGIVRFETREELLKVLMSLESKDNQFYIEGSWCQVLDGGVIPELEYSARLQSLLESPEIQQRENSEVISKILVASMKSYVDKIEDVLNKNSDGLELRELTRRQLDIVNETNVLLKLEIRQNIRQDEPLEAHLQFFQAYMDHYWNYVVEANNKNLHTRKKWNDKEEHLETNAECKNLRQHKHSNGLLETRIDDLTDKGDPIVPLPPDEDIDADADKDFVMVIKSDIDGGFMSKPTKVTLTEKEFAIEELQKSLSQIKSTDAAIEVRKSSPKLGRKGNHPEPTSSARGEQLQNLMSRISDAQSMLELGLGHTGQKKFASEKTSGYGSSASRMRSGEPTTRNISIPKEQVGKRLFQQRTDCDAMVTIPAPDSTINERSSRHVRLGEKMEDFKATIVKQYEPMDIDNPEVYEAAKTISSAEENIKGKAERTTPESSEALKKKQEKEQLERDQTQKEEELRIAASQAVFQMKSVLPSAIEYWLRNHFHGRNIEEIKNIYNHALGGVQAEGHKKVSVQLRKALDRKIDAECKDYCMAYLTDVQNRMRKFYREMEKKFEYQDFFAANELDKLYTEEYQKISQDLESSEPEEHRLLGIGCKTIGNYFHEQNVKNMAENMMPIVLRNYNDEMTRFLRGGVYAPNNLKEIHSNLTGRLVKEFRNSFRLPVTGKIPEDVENRSEELTARLVQEFQKHLQQNKTNLERKQQQIIKILEASKKFYVEKIEDVLDKNSDGLELRELKRRQEDIANEATVLLRMEIQQKIRQDEPLEAHVQSLQAYIDNYWKAVLGANSNNLQKRKEREAELQEQERRRLAEKAANERKTESKMHSTSFQGNGKGRVRLPPLVFQLQSTRIRMGMCLDGKPIVLSNASGEQSTPLVVGLTNGGDLVYGTEAQANIPEEGDACKSELSRYWWIADHLITSGRQPWTEDVQINAETKLYKITVEFLLGFILNKLKEHVEADMKGVIFSAVITVPCWLCSTQRIQVKDGAKLAGFEEVYLINEVAAAAFACASSGLRSSSNHNILILSENSGNIDASVYSLSGSVRARNVTMVGHCGSYQTQSIVSAVREFIGRGVKHLLNGVEGNKSSEDKKRQALQKIQKVVNQAQDPSYSSQRETSEPREVFVISDLEDWRPLLEQVGTRKARKICDIDEESGVVIGASLLSQNPDKIKEIVRGKLLFDVIRKHGAEAGVQVISTDMLPTTDRRSVTTTFPMLAKEADIFQSGPQGTLRVGRLKLHRNLSYGQRVELCLSLNNEAIVKLKSVMISSTNTNSKDPVLRHEFDWITPNLTPEDTTRLQSLLESLGTEPMENSEVLDAKQQLLQQCNEMKMQLETGTVFKIKSEMVRDMLLKRIEEAVKFAQHENSTLEQIQGQMDALARWSSKYVK